MSGAIRRFDAARLSPAQRLGLTAALVALGVALSAFAVPIGPARVFPFQHLVNVVAGVMVGPLHAVVAALSISIIRNALGTGTILAFPGSIFGALLVGLAYHRLRRSDAIAFLEPVGTVLLGATTGYLLIAGLDGPTTLLGIVRALPPSPQAYLGLVPPGLLALMAAFAASSIPGAILGYLALRALRRAHLR